MTSRSRREINSSIVFAGVDGPVPHYGALDAICPETQFRLSHQSATGQGKLALIDAQVAEWEVGMPVPPGFLEVGGELVDIR